MRSLGYRQAAEHLRGESRLPKPSRAPSRVTATMPSASSPGFGATPKCTGWKSFGPDAATHAQETVGNFSRARREVADLPTL